MNINDIVGTAVRGQRTMEAMTVSERITLIERLAKVIETRRADFENALIEEGRKTEEGAQGEVSATIERIRLAAQEARSLIGEFIPSGLTSDTKGKFAIVRRVPLGVVGVISPFNYPLFIPAVKAVDALLAGNSVVLKPASLTRLPMLLFEGAVNACGFPLGAFAVVAGDSSVGEQLVTHPRVAAISFTGSTEVGQRIASKAGAKRLQLEMGGKGIAVILPDADLELAAEKVVFGSLKNSGQRCDAVSLVVYCGRANYERFLELVVKKADELNTPKFNGRLITEESAKRVVKLVADARAAGARVMLGGDRQGSLVFPTVVADVSLSSSLAREETFGPVVAIAQVNDVAEAVAFHEESPFGLDSSVFSKNLGNALAVARKLRAGSVTINDFPKHGLGAFPYGGMKESGLGREGLGHGMLEMTQLQTIVVPETECSYTESASSR